MRRMVPPPPSGWRLPRAEAGWVGRWWAGAGSPRAGGGSCRVDRDEGGLQVGRGLDGGLVQMLEGGAGWTGLPGGADLGEHVCSLVVGSRDVVELTTLEIAAHLLDQEAVAGRVGVPGIPIARDLLHHQVQVATKDVSDADLLGQL